MFASHGICKFFWTGLCSLYLLFPSNYNQYKDHHQQQKNHYFDDLKPFFPDLTFSGVLR
jgi:hypothetical protein